MVVFSNDHAGLKEQDSSDTIYLLVAYHLCLQITDHLPSKIIFLIEWLLRHLVPLLMP